MAGRTRCSLIDGDPWDEDLAHAHTASCGLLEKGQRWLAEQ
jgi:hypothetical protein